MMTADVIVVDDDPDAREILELVLGTLELSVRKACDGVEALKLIEQQRPSLIILDLTMPRLDGYAVMKALRRSPETEKIPVIVFTASQVDAEKAARMGIPKSRLLRKGDLSMTSLRVLVTQLLDGVDLPLM